MGVIAYHGLYSGSEMQRKSIAKHSLPDHWYELVFLLHQPDAFYTTGRTLLSMKTIWYWHQGDGCVEHCSVSGFRQSHPNGKTGLPFAWQRETERYLWGDRANIGCGFCGTPSAQDWYSANKDTGVTRLAVQSGYSPECAASPGV